MPSLLKSTSAIRRWKRLECQLCGGEDEDLFHALVRCPNARAISHAMRSCWDIPDPNKLQNTGPGWFLHALSTLDKTKAAMLLMIGEVIFSACSSIPHCTGALEDEPKACEEGLRVAMGWSEKFIILESDCAEALSMAYAKHPDRSPYAMCVIQFVTVRM
ncbi:hypothetical protein BRADI_5g03501v3 [Brachypodium distachyon]|uniref:RNase H type-1 domain-containing protein n=1 Tax=Brachypodium distachyon TaxID=15368 RepID=A0A0Q3E6L5_BRADI|nr:hypothetical protein BRADI_5g03501v3 [Brachypodium distachyon]